MVKICVICTSRSSLKPLSEEHRGLLESLVGTAVHLWELRDLTLLVCSDCLSLTNALVKFRDTAINGVKHLLNLKRKKEVESEVLIKPEPLDKVYTVQTSFQIEIEQECVNKSQDGIKTEVSDIGGKLENVEDVIPINTIQVTDTDSGEKVNDSTLALISQVKKIVVHPYPKSKIPQQNHVSMVRPQTTNVAPFPKMQLVPRNRLFTPKCRPPLLGSKSPQFLPNSSNNYKTVNAPRMLTVLPVWMQKGLNVAMPALTKMASMTKAPKFITIAPTAVKERNSEPGNNINNNKPKIAEDVIVKVNWYTRVFSPAQIFIARARERASKEFIDAPYKCKTCVLVFDTQEEMDAHAKEHVLEPDQLPCRVCALPMRAADEDAHERRHATRYQCARCAFSTEHVRAIKAHECSSQPKRKRKPCSRKKYDDTFRCAICFTRYADQASLDGHNERMHKYPEVLKCEVCNQKFTARVRLQIHMRKKHKTKENIESLHPELYCAECNISFTSVSKYRDHRMTSKHCSKDSSKFECDHCKKIFRTKSGVSCHIKLVHSVEKPVECKECGKSLVSLYRMRRHMRLYHKEGERPRPHVCHLCGKAFLVMKTLSEHLTMHSGLRPHKCKLCPATFTYTAALFTHNRLKHLKIKGKTKKNDGDENCGEKNDADESLETVE